MVGIIVCFTFAAICLIISILQFLQKGFCFNNAYIYASEEEREKMDKKPYYMQSGIVFALLFCSFGSFGLYGIFQFPWLIIAFCFIAITFIYAIVSSIKTITKNK